MVAVIEVLLPTVTPVAAVPPIVTVAPARKPVPVIVTGVPPAVVPDVGEIELTVGAGFTGVVKVNPLVSVPVWVSVFFTTTLTAPAACAGVVAVIEVLLPTAHSGRRRASDRHRRARQEARARDRHRRSARRRSRRRRDRSSPSAPDCRV